MDDALFDSPIFVRDGIYIVREITGLMEVIDFLEAWPERQRDLVYERTLATCNAVFDGQKPLVAAYVAFTGFAKHMDILEDSATIMPWLAAAQGSGGRAPA